MPSNTLSAGFRTELIQQFRHDTSEAVTACRSDFDVAGMGRWGVSAHGQLDAPLLSTGNENEMLSWDELMYPSGLEDLPHM